MPVMGVSFHKIGVMKSSTKEERQKISIEISIIVLHNKDTTTKLSGRWFYIKYWDLPSTDNQ